MLRKTFPFADFKMRDDGPGGFSGYGSTWNNVDLAGEIVVKGAFAKSLDRFKKDGFIAVGHEWNDLPVGTIADAYEDERGLFLDSDFHSSEEAQKARAWVRERHERGKSVGLSIGYTVKASEPSKAGLLLKELDLFEVSIVTVPCNPQAQTTGVKEAPPALVFKSLPELRAYVDTLLGSTLYPLLFDEKSGQTERLAKVDAALAGLPATIAASLRAAVAGSDEDELETEFKNVFSPPALAAGRFVDQLDAALAAVKGATDRYARYLAVKEADGRAPSPDRREQLLAIHRETAELLAKTAPPQPLDLSLLQMKASARRRRLLALGVGAPL